jgi:hypothetical protein
MNSVIPPYCFSDPDERLLASVMPPPPAPFATRVWHGVVRVAGTEAGRVARWLHSREPWQRWLLAGVASGGLVLGMSQSGASSATGAASQPEVAVRTALLSPVGACPPAARSALAPEVLPAAQPDAAPLPLQQPRAAQPDSTRAAAMSTRPALREPSKRRDHRARRVSKIAKKARSTRGHQRGARAGRNRQASAASSSSITSWAELAQRPARRRAPRSAL